MIEQCPPRYATKRTESRPTYGAQAAKFAAALHTPLMSWQRYVLDVALEYDPDTGWPYYRNVTVTVPRQNGKLLSLDTPILTTTGWKTMGTVAVGDSVYGSDGQPTKVLFTSEIQIPEHAYEVEFTDGTVTKAGGEHQWYVWDKNAQNKEAWSKWMEDKKHGNRWTGKGDRPTKKEVPSGSWRVMTTDDIVATRYAWTRLDNDHKEYRYRVRCDAVPQTPQANLPIDPYILGYWLGDGTSAAGTFTCHEDDQPELCKALANAGYEPHVANTDSQCIRTYGLQVDLRKLGVLNNKHIPDIYQTASPEQRRALLAGLLDSDGYIGGKSKTPRVEFCSCSKQLADDAFHLIRSLGQRVMIHSSDAKLYGRVTSTKYRITWTPTFNPFKLYRKADQWIKPDSDRQKWFSIVDIRGIPLEPMRCIQVSAEDGVYLIESTFIPTHNTTMLLVLFLVRALAHEKQSIIYTAQDRNEAKKKLVNEWIPLLEETNFRNYFTTTQANGNEAMRFHNGSLLSLAATTKRSAHGNVIHLGVVDEAFSLPDARMEQAFVPAMRTKKDAQYWVTSTAGTYADSPYLWGKIESGRKLVADDVRNGSCYFEWSADEDADPSLESTWRSCMPALGYTMDADTIRAEYIAAAADNNLSEFKRAALNQWVTSKVDPVIPLDQWNSLITTDTLTDGQWALAFDVAEDRSASSIAAAWKRPDGNYQVVLIATGNGTAWVAQRVADIWHNRRPVGIWLDRNGPAGSLISDLQTLNVPLVNDVPVADLAKGCGQFYDACMGAPADEEHEATPPTLRHLNDEVLLATLDGAAKRPVSDAWVWSRKNSNIDISPLVAVTMALYGAKQLSRTPSVFSIREIMEEKRKRLEEIADAVAGEEVLVDLSEPTQVTLPEPVNPVSNVKRVPI